LPNPRGLPDHERAKTELKILMPEDAKEAFGHGIRAKRSKSGAIRFRSPRRGFELCTGPVKPSARSRRRWPRRRPSSPTRRSRNRAFRSLSLSAGRCREQAPSITRNVSKGSLVVVDNGDSVSHQRLLTFLVTPPETRIRCLTKSPGIAL
jgi:hypothetical protein